MENNNYQNNGWKAAQQFSVKATMLQFELDQLKDEKYNLQKEVERLKKENERLNSILMTAFSYTGLV